MEYIETFATGVIIGAGMSAMSYILWDATWGIITILGG